MMNIHISSTNIVNKLDNRLRLRKSLKQAG